MKSYTHEVTICAGAFRCAFELRPETPDRSKARRYDGARNLRRGKTYASYTLIVDTHKIDTVISVFRT